MSEPTKRDVLVENHGNIWMFHLYTPAAKEWVADNVELEGWQWLGSSAFGVDYHFAAPLVARMQAGGLRLL